MLWVCAIRIALRTGRRSVPRCRPDQGRMSPRHGTGPASRNSYGTTTRDAAWVPPPLGRVGQPTGVDHGLDRRHLVDVADVEIADAPVAVHKHDDTVRHAPLVQHPVFGGH